MISNEIKLVPRVKVNIFERADRYLKIIEGIGEKTRIGEKDCLELLDFKLSLIQYINLELGKLQ